VEEVQEKSGKIKNEWKKGGGRTWEGRDEGFRPGACMSRKDVMKDDSGVRGPWMD